MRRLTRLSENHWRCRHGLLEDRRRPDFLLDAGSMRVNEGAQVFVTYLQYIEEADRTKSWQQLDDVALSGRARLDGCCRIAQSSGVGQEGADRPLADAHALEFDLANVVGEKVLGTHGGSFVTLASLFYRKSPA
jgi:hypothetical protein